MAVGMFLSFSSAQLASMRDTAQAQMISGENRVITLATSGDVTTQKVWQLEPAVFWDELNYALRRVGALGVKVTRTRIKYV
jgi:hypothetical protein